MKKSAMVVELGSKTLRLHLDSTNRAFTFQFFRILKFRSNKLHRKQMVAQVKLDDSEE